MKDVPFSENHEGTGRAFGRVVLEEPTEANDYYGRWAVTVDLFELLDAASHGFESALDAISDFATDSWLLQQASYGIDRERTAALTGDRLITLWITGDASMVLDDLDDEEMMRAEAGEVH